jgi:phosphoribosylpyrophosphate synthetase
VAIASKLGANLLVAAGVTRVMTMDLHAPQIQGFFDVPVDHMDASAIFVPYIKSLNLPNMMICAPDNIPAPALMALAITAPSRAIIPGSTTTIRSGLAKTFPCLPAISTTA